MKKIIYMIALLALTIAGCEKDNMVAVISTNVTAPVILTPAAATTLNVVVPDTANKFTIKWSKADFGVDAVISYAVQMDAAGKNFATALNLANTTNDSFEMTIGGLNKKVLEGLGLPANATSDVEFRVIATLSEKNKSTSKVAKLTIKTYKDPAPDRLFVPGAYQGWAPDLAPFIRQIDVYNYEGYVYMGIGDYYKFTSAADFAHINYGDDGAGKLTVDGNAGGLKVNAAGYYKFNVNTHDLTYSATLVNSFGIVGSATAGDCIVSTPMTYNQTTKVWTITANLIPGAVKFRADDAWALNYGPADSNSFNGTLVQTDAAITINTAGSYTITINFNQTTNKDYTYTVVKN